MFLRKDFYRLSFPADASTHQRITWKNKYQQQLLDDVGIPSRNPIALRYVYVRRSSTLVVECLKQGKYGDIKFECSDESAENLGRRHRHFILRAFPTDENLDLIRENLGDPLNDHVHKLIRIKRDGQPTSSVRIIWTSHEEAPPNELDVYPDMQHGPSPRMSIKEVDAQPTCYNCNAKGHIKKWCPKQKGNGVVALGDINQQAVVNSTSTERAQSALSVNHWFRDRHHGGTVTQRSRMLKERESNDEQYDLKMIMQEIKAMREEINNLKTQVQQLQSDNFVMNQSSPSPLEESNDDHQMTAGARPDDDPDDGHRANDSEGDDRNDIGADARSDGKQRDTGDTDGVFINSDEIMKVDEDEGESESTIKNALSTENKDEKSKKEQGNETSLGKTVKESQQDAYTSPMTKAASVRSKRVTATYGIGIPVE